MSLRLIDRTALVIHVDGYLQNEAFLHHIKLGEDDFWIDNMDTGTIIVDYDTKLIG